MNPLKSKFKIANKKKNLDLATQKPNSYACLKRAEHTAYDKKERGSWNDACAFHINYTKCPLEKPKRKSFLVYYADITDADKQAENCEVWTKGNKHMQ